MIPRERQPLPAGLRPMLAMLMTAPPPDDGSWALEMKWDGVRALAFVERGRVRLMSRTERDITVAYPELAGPGHATRHQQLLLDGGAGGFGPDRWAQVEALQPRLHLRAASPAAPPARQDPAPYPGLALL